MPVIVNCPSCRGPLRVPDELLGKNVRCPTCQATFEAQQAPVPPPPEPPPNLPEPSSVRLPPEPAAPPPPSPGPWRAPPENQPEPEVEPEPCPYCGKLIDPNANVCPHCRAELEDEDFDRPWDRIRGEVRRDCEPHRGTLVMILGIVSVALGAASLPAVCCGPLGLLTLIATPLGITAWVLGHKDLQRMQLRQMDPQGESQTRAGWICGIIGTALGICGLLGCGIYVSFIVFTMFAQ